MNVHLSVLTLLMCAIVANTAYADVRVYRFDGSVQCGANTGKTLEEDIAVLESLGAKAISSEKRKLPVMIFAVCGAPTGMTNTFVIKDEDWATVKKSFVGPAGFSEWMFDNPTWVYKYNGTLQCDLGAKITSEQMEMELEAAGIKVLDRQEGQDGLMHAAVCGGSTGAVNLYLVAATDLMEAKSLGFEVYLAPTEMKLMGEGLPLPWPFPW